MKKYLLLLLLLIPAEGLTETTFSWSMPPAPYDPPISYPITCNAKGSPPNCKSWRKDVYAVRSSTVKYFIVHPAGDLWVWKCSRLPTGEWKCQFKK